MRSVTPCTSAPITLHLQAVHLRLVVILTAKTTIPLNSTRQLVSVMSTQRVFFSEKLKVFLFVTCSFRHCLLYVLYLTNLV
jgi:hypothetical protein